MRPFQNIYNKYPWFGKEDVQIPGIATASNFIGNIKGGVAFGFTGNPEHLNPANGGFRGTPFNFSYREDSSGNKSVAWNPQMSLGGMASAGYGVFGGAAVGAGAGALASQFIPGGNPIAGAAVGAGVGAATLALTPVAIGAAAKGTVNLMGKMPDIYAGIGNGTLNALGAIGKAAGTAATTVMNALQFSSSDLKGLGVGVGGRLKNGLNPVGRHVNAAANIMSKFVKEAPGANPDALIKNYKFTGLGVAALGAGSLIKGGKDAYNIMMQDKIGQRDPYISQVAPQVRLMDNAGATGDLVFALNNNRRG